MMPGFYFLFFIFLLFIICILISKKRKTHDSYPNHEFELKNNSKPYWCNGCRLPAYGPRYSSCDDSDIDLHVECFPTRTSPNPICEGLTFNFFETPPKSCARNRKWYCDACGQAINGFVYHCEEKDWYLHPFCRDLKNTIDIEGVKYRLRDEVSRKCRLCKQKKLNGVKGSWSYLADKRLFHVYCVTLWRLDKWKINASKDRNFSASENRELLPLQTNFLRKSVKRRKYLWAGVKSILSILPSIISGDPTIPTIVLGGFFREMVELVSK